MSFSPWSVLLRDILFPAILGMCCLSLSISPAISLSSVALKCFVLSTLRPSCYVLSAGLGLTGKGQKQLNSRVCVPSSVCSLITNFQASPCLATPFKIFLCPSFSFLDHPKSVSFIFWDSSVMVIHKPGCLVPWNTHRAAGGGPGPDRRISWLRHL